MYKETLWYEIYAGRKVNWDAFNKYFDKNGCDDTWYIYYIEDNYEPRFELHVHLNGDIVTRAEPFKAEVSGGHGRPQVDVKTLTSSEKKYAIEIFEECLADRVGSDFEVITSNAVDTKVEFQGYKAVNVTRDSIVFISPENKKIKLQKKLLLKALDYSHLDVSILKDPEKTELFAKCFGVTRYEPLFAILQIVDPTKYIEFPEINRKYRYGLMETAIKTGQISVCESYTDVLKEPKNDVVSFCDAAIAQGNEELLFWIISNTEGAQCDLCSIIGVAIQRSNETLFERLLNSDKYDASQSNPSHWRAPMYIALNKPGREKYIWALLKKGFEMPASIAYRYYNTLTMDTIKDLMSFKVTLDQKTVDRIFSENREDIIEILEQEPLKYCTQDMLFTAYINSGCYDKFKHLLESGYQNTNDDLFHKAYINSQKWTDLWLEHGFDINISDSKLLHNACKELAVDEAIYLLENGANPYLKSQYSETVFEKAGGFHGYLDDDEIQEKIRLCKYLIEMGVSPITESRRSPSILQYMFGMSEDFDYYLIDWLAQNGCINTPDADTRDFKDRHLPLRCVLSSMNRGKYKPELLKRFIEAGAKLDADGITKDKFFLEAVDLCELPELQLVVSAGANIHERTWEGTNALFEAVQRRRSVNIINYLIELGLDVNDIRKEMTLYGTYPQKRLPATSVLDIAIESKNVEVIELLRSKGAMLASDLLMKGEV